MMSSGELQRLSRILTTPKLHRRPSKYDVTATTVHHRFENAADATSSREVTASSSGTASACSSMDDELQRSRESTMSTSPRPPEVDNGDVDIVVPPNRVANYRPVPPKQPNSPRGGVDGKRAASGAGRLHWRFVKADGSAPQAADDAKCVLVGGGKTATSARRRRVRNPAASSPVTFTASQPTAGAAKSAANRDATTVTVIRPPARPDPAECEAGGAKFDVTKDELTVAWLSLVRSVRMGQAAGDDDTDAVTPESPPAEPSPPQKCATPCPRNFSTSSRGGQRHHHHHAADPRSPDDDEHDDGKSPAAGSDDSAYFSSSVSSRPPSTNLSRPPSGGKRVAASSLSSSSSQASSDEESKPTGDEVHVTAASHSREPMEAASPLSSGGSSKLSRRCYRIVKTKNGKKYLRRDDPAAAEGGSGDTSHAPPAPHILPKKPAAKKEALPMRLRALPSSFWEQPNRVNPSAYSVLPPVQPLFRQYCCDDVANIRPITPLGEAAPSSSQGARGGGDSVVTVTDDSDLLMRLFDSVEPHNSRHTGIRVRRGRPKKVHSRVPRPRLKLDNNPVIIESITEKLLSKLTIERHRVTRASPLLATDHHLSSAPRLPINPGVAAAGNSADFFFTQHPPDQLMCATPSRCDAAALSVADTLSLPQLSMPQDYSQLLSEVAAVL